MESNSIIRYVVKNYNTGLTESDMMLPASYHSKEGKHYVTYDVYDSDTMEKTVVEIEFDDKQIFIKRSGLMKFEMLVKDEKFIYASNYITSYGSIPMTIESRSYSMEFVSGLYILNLEYLLKQQEEAFMIKKVQIFINVKELCDHDH